MIRPVFRLFLLGLGLSSVACSPSDPVANPALNEPDLVVFLVAGLRGDMPDRPGAGKALVDVLGSSTSLRSQNGYAQAPSPFVSFASFLTGRYPSAIPICGIARRNQSRGVDDPWCARIPEDRPTLPKVLSLYGYATALVYSGLEDLDVLSGDFEHVAELPAVGSSSRTDWPALQRAAPAWWRTNAAQPRLLVVVVGDLFLPLRHDLKAALDLSPSKGRRDRWSQRAREKVRRVYETETSGVSSEFRKLGKALDLDGNSAWWVVSGLSGLNLAETTGSQPMPTGPFFWDVLLDRTVRVPIGLSAPRSVTLPHDTVVELVDLLPTLISAAGAVVPAEVDGQDWFDRSSKATAVDAYAEFGDMLAVRAGDELLSFRALVHHGSLLDPAIDAHLDDATTALERFSLHDVRHDPLQRENQIGSDRVRFELLRAALVQTRKSARASSADRLTPNRIEALRLQAAEGYW